MEKNVITISIIGVGARGGEAYGRYIHASKDRFKITSICDVNEYRLKKYGETFEVPEEDRFVSEDVFFEKKRSDVLLIGTMDRMHVRQAVRALDLGYDLLLEKPISDDAEELKMLTAKAKKKALCMLTISDHIYRKEALSSEERQLGFGKMMEVALELA